jgi:predicted permease
MNLVVDLRAAVSSLRRAPGFSLAAMLTLGLGMGLSTAIFSIFYGVLLRPLDLPQPERVYTIWQNMEARGGSQEEATSRGVFCDWRVRNRSFEAMAAIIDFPADLTGIDPPENVAGTGVSREYFSVLRVKPVLGRGFLKEEETDGKQFVAILSHELWARRFGSDPSLLGKPIMIGDLPFTVVGILPKGFHPPLNSQTEIWMPLPLAPTPDDRGYSYVRAIGRLKPGITPQAARADMQLVTKSLAREYPAALHGVGVRLVPVLDSIVGSTRKLLMVLLGAVALVLLVACVNVGNLALTRATARTSELALRTVLGAGRGRLARQLAAESVFLAIGGAALGLLVGALCLSVLRGLAPPQTPRLDSIRLDGPVFACTFAVSLVAGLIAGLLPALWIWRRHPADALRATAGTSATRSTTRLRSALILAEIAVSLVLLVGAGLLLRTLAALSHVDPGFHTENLVLGRLTLWPGRYPKPHDKASFMAQLEERLLSRPEIAAAGVISTMPLADGRSETPVVLEWRRDPAGEAPTVIDRYASPGYFKTVGLPLRAGRLFATTDVASSPQVALVNERFVQLFAKGESLLGRRLRPGRPEDATEPWRTIVGIVGNVHGQSLDRPPDPEIYVPFAQQPSQEMTVVARAPGATSAALREIQTAANELSPGQIVSHRRTLEEAMDRSLSPRRFIAVVVGMFAAVTLLLAAIGIYGVVALAVSQRQRELAIRMALGASPSSLPRLFLRWSSLLVAGGVLLGLAGSLITGRILVSLLYGVQPMDGLTLVVVILVLALVALLASLVPALRASRIDPAQILKT